MSDPTGASSVIALDAGTSRARVRGGDLLSVVSWQLDGAELLARPEGLPGGYLVHGRCAGVTLLHPWANRLSATTFALAGQTVRVDTSDPRLSADAHGLAIHGVTAAPPWQLSRSTAVSAMASLAWEGHPAFPFPHTVEVRFALSAPSPDASELSIHTTLVADADAAVPVSFGWHPYFTCLRPARLGLPDLAWVEADARGLPTGGTRPAGAHERRLTGEDALDDGVTALGTRAAMHVDVDDRRVDIALRDGYPQGQVFAPPDAAILSLEPMTAPTDALVSGDGLTILAAGERYEAEFSIRASAALSSPGR